MTVGERSGQHPRALVRRCNVVGACLVLLLVACGDDNGPDGSLEATGQDPTTSTTGLPACSESEHLVVVNVFGAITADEPGPFSWATDPDTQPVARPGAADVLSAYMDRGYGILYISSLAAETEIGGQAVTEALTVWLGAHGFPIGENTRVWAREDQDGEVDASIALIEELARLSNAQVQLEVGYASDEDEVFPLVTGGIRPEQVFTVAEAVRYETSTSLPDEDFEAHLPEVQDLEPVCE